ncbi:MAG: hypothetical protein ACM3MK_02385, partial [Chitinophagales bacterium]
MGNRITYAFASSYTGRGLFSCLAGMIDQLERLVILKGFPGSGKSTLMRRTGLYLAEKGYEVQFWPSPLDPAYLQGIFLPRLKTAIIDENLPVEENRLQGVAVHYINLDSCLDEQQISGNQQEIKLLASRMDDLLQGVYLKLNEMKHNKIQLNSHYNNRLNLQKLEACSSDLIRRIIGSQDRERHFFASTITSEGLFHYYEDITRDISNRYVLQGPPGQGKSWIMLSLARESLERGHRVDFYHSGVDPDCIEVLVI